MQGLIVKRPPYIVRDDYVRGRVLDLIAKLDLSKPWEITVEPHRARRSLNQNSLYHKWVGIVAAETGHSHDEVHEFLKAEFLPPRHVEIGGRTRECRPSTTALKIDEMSQYMNQVYAWAGSTLGIILPVPEELGHAA